VRGIEEGGAPNKSLPTMREGIVQSHLHCTSLYPCVRVSSNPVFIVITHTRIIIIIMALDVGDKTISQIEIVDKVLAQTRPPGDPGESIS
jgi:hypothetical protein